MLDKLKERYKSTGWVLADKHAVTCCEDAGVNVQTQNENTAGSNPTEKIAQKMKEEKGEKLKGFLIYEMLLYSDQW